MRLPFYCLRAPFAPIPLLIKNRHPGDVAVCEKYEIIITRRTISHDSELVSAGLEPERDGRRRPSLSAVQPLWETNVQH